MNFKNKKSRLFVFDKTKVFVLNEMDKKYSIKLNSNFILKSKLKDIQSRMLVKLYWANIPKDIFSRFVRKVFYPLLLICYQIVLGEDVSYIDLLGLGLNLFWLIKDWKRSLFD